MTSRHIKSQRLLLSHDATAPSAPGRRLWVRPELVPSHALCSPDDDFDPASDDFDPASEDDTASPAPGQSASSADVQPSAALQAAPADVSAHHTNLYPAHHDIRAHQWQHTPLKDMERLEKDLPGIIAEWEAGAAAGLPGPDLLRTVVDRLKAIGGAVGGAQLSSSLEPDQICLMQRERDRIFQDGAPLPDGRYPSFLVYLMCAKEDKTMYTEGVPLPRASMMGRIIMDYLSSGLPVSEQLFAAYVNWACYCQRYIRGDGRAGCCSGGYGYQGGRVQEVCLRIRTQVTIAYLRLDIRGVLVLSEPARNTTLASPTITGDYTQLKQSFKHLVPLGTPVLAAQYFSSASEVGPVAMTDLLSGYYKIYYGADPDVPFLHRFLAHTVLELTRRGGILRWAKGLRNQELLAMVEQLSEQDIDDFYIELERRDEARAARIKQAQIDRVQPTNNELRETEKGRAYLAKRSVKYINARLEAKVQEMQGHIDALNAGEVKISPILPVRVGDSCGDYHVLLAVVGTAGGIMQGKDFAKQGGLSLAQQTYWKLHVLVDKTPSSQEMPLVCWLETLLFEPARDSSRTKPLMKKYAAAIAALQKAFPAVKEVEGLAKKTAARPMALPEIEAYMAEHSIPAFRPRPSNAKKSITGFFKGRI
ncbi:hypothetical protein WJX73_005411 [Symbiochloris irregularis]|uniref:Uncharacterized protein n=1 Tax=Symbiochloris irregularis TaxID=706552 RepID=A0AAW1NUS6_9CHLO